MRAVSGKSVFLAASGMLIASTATNAADAVVVEPIYTPPPVVQAYDWSGVYLGGTLGYGWGRTGEADVEGQIGGVPLDPALEAAIEEETDQSFNGLIGGAFAGVNWQNGTFVLGLEGGIDFDDLGSTGSFVAPGPTTVDISVRSDWLATIGGRVGGAFDRALLFAEGGLAVGRGTVGFDLTDGGGTESFEDSQTHYGYYLGAGADFAVTENVFVGAKYNFVDLGNATYSFGEGPDAITAEGDVHYHIGKVRLGFKF